MSKNFYFDKADKAQIAGDALNEMVSMDWNRKTAQITVQNVYSKWEFQFLHEMARKWVMCEVYPVQWSEKQIALVLKLRQKIKAEK